MHEKERGLFMEELLDPPNVDQESMEAVESQEATGTQDVMQQEPVASAQPIVTSSQPKNTGRRIMLSALGLVLVGGVAYGAYSVLHMTQPKAATVTDVKTSPTEAKKVTQVSPATTTPTDTAIDTSLTTIDSGITQATSDQTDASTAVSDTDQQITVPTE